MSSTKLTRKTFKGIAETVAGLPVNREGYVEHGDVVAGLADFLEGTNPRFDRDRFFRACMASKSGTQPDDQQAGWLIASRHVVFSRCLGDQASSGAVTLFHVNIDRYAQHCHSCGVQIHKPQSDAWPELFSTADCPICATKETMEFRADTHDGVEVGIVSHNGREYSALGSVVTPLQVTAYKDGDKLTTWAGESIGTCRVTSSWPTPRSYISNHMYQLEAVVNGVRYTGRCAGDGMIFNGRRVAGQ